MLFLNIGLVKGYLKEKEGKVQALNCQCSWGNKNKSILRKRKREKIINVSVINCTIGF